jgi:hypothetical protein
MILRCFRRARIVLAAYQKVEAEPYYDESGQFTKSGEEPLVLRLQLTTAMDEEFVNRTVTAILTEQDQRSLIALFEANLEPANQEKRDALEIARRRTPTYSAVDW